MRNTKQRNEILKTVLESCDHPNAETVYLRIKKNMPNISLGTVYRNLCILSGQGLIRQIRIADGADRYDKTLKNHSHLFCRRCGGVSDIEYDFTPLDDYNKISKESGCRIDGIELIFNGICKNCRDKNKE